MSTKEWGRGREAGGLQPCSPRVVLLRVPLLCHSIAVFFGALLWMNWAAEVAAGQQAAEW